MVWQGRKLVFLTWGLGCFLSVLTQGQSPSSTTIPPPTALEIYIGETVQVSLPQTESAFPVDDTMLETQMVGTMLTLKGLRGGVTHVVYWVQGEPRQITVHVLVPEIVKRSHLGPRFVTGKPYFIYDFSNQSSFDNDRFFIEPSYSHFLQIQSPFFRGNMTSSIRYTHKDHVWKEGELKDIRVFYNDPDTEIVLGNAFSHLALLRTRTPLTGVVFFGSALELKNVWADPQIESSESDRLSLFSGIKIPINIIDDFQDDFRFSGVNYYWIKVRDKSIFQDLWNVSAFTYRPTELLAHRVGGVFEFQQHLTVPWTWGSGAYVGEGGYGIRINSGYEYPQGIFQTGFDYVDGGLEDFSGSIQTHDRYFGEINLEHWFDVRKTFILDGISNYSLDVADAPGTFNQESFITLLRLRNSPTHRDLTAFDYSFVLSHAKTDTTISHHFGWSHAYPTGQFSDLHHSFSVVTSNEANQEYQLFLGTDFNYERTDFRLDLRFQGSWSDHEDYELIGVLAEARAFWHLTRGDMRVLLQFVKRDLHETQYQITFTPIFTYQPTTVHFFSLASTMTLRVDSTVSLSGSFQIQYRMFFGPGVDGEPLWPNMFGSSSNYVVDGRTYIDRNYSGSWEGEDSALSDVLVRLNKKTQTQTNPEGRFAFRNAGAGENTLVVDRGSLPHADTLDGLYEQRVVFGERERKKKTVDFPFFPKKASIRVQVWLDSNDNGEADSADYPVYLPEIVVQSQSGVQRKGVSTGGAIFRGLDVGTYSVIIEDVQVPENMVMVTAGPISVKIEEIKEYEVVFLVKPMRSVRGRLIVPIAESAHVVFANVTVTVGELRSSVDKDGYYWIEGLKPGSYRIQVQGLPPHLCVAPSRELTLEVSTREFGREISFQIEKCPTPSS